MTEGGVRIVKVGGTPPPAPDKTQQAGKTRKARPAMKKMDLHKKPKFGILKRGKTARKKPRFEAVRDPTSAPPLRILTHKGAETRRKKVEEEVKKMPPHKIHKTLRDNNLAVKNPKVAERVLIDAKVAGMISDA
jgi:hypothetical protein